METNLSGCLNTIVQLPSSLMSTPFAMISISSASSLPTRFSMIARMIGSIPDETMTTGMLFALHH